MNTVKWGKSQDGYTESKCGRFKITPNFLGRCDPIGFHLKELDKGMWFSREYLPSQKQCKERAEVLNRTATIESMNRAIDEAIEWFRAGRITENEKCDLVKTYVCRIAGLNGKPKLAAQLP